MAGRSIIGLDIGSFSVKVSRLSTSFRSFAWEGYREFEIPHASRARPERAAAAVLAELGRETSGAVVVTALPGDRVMTRFLELPFDDPKRIDSVLGFELEGQIPLGVEDMTYAYQVVGPKDNGQTEIFAAAVRHDEMERYLDGLQDAEIDPRVITLDTTSYVNLYDHLVGEGTVLFVDLGHQTTKLCVVENGRMRLARSIGRGGHAVTQSISERFDIPFDEAEAMKHAQGELITASELPPTPLQQACAQSMQKVLMSIRQTCQAVARDGNPVGQILVTGGGSRLKGCLPWLQQQLGAPVRPLSLETLEFNKLPKGASAVTGAAKSLGLALHQAGAANLSTLNFRRGPYAYEGDYKYLQDKLAYLGGLAATLLLVGSVYGVVKSNNLQKTLDAQYAALGEFTSEHLGKREKSFAKTVKKLQAPPTQDETALFPDMTAIAVLEKITAIQQRLNGRGQAGGPTPPSAPGLKNSLDQRRVRANPMNNRPGQLDAGVRARLAQPGIGAPPVRDAPTRPGARRDRKPSLEPGDKLPRPGTPEQPEGEPAEGPEGEGPEGAVPDEQPVDLELSQVDIDVYGDVRVTVETHESNVKGKEDFRRAIAEEKCFHKVERRDIGEVVSTGRHQDWVRFEVTFEVDCNPEKKAAGRKGRK